jgi:hypothetical protein
MCKPRDLFVPVDIFAISGANSLLEGGKIPLIGYYVGRLRYLQNGNCCVPIEVCFHFGREKKDLFFFENQRMVFQSVTVNTIEWQYMGEIYSKCAQIKEISPQVFIDNVVCAYVVKELGF